MTLTDYAKRWLKYCATVGCRKSVLDRYTYALELHILPVLGDLYVDAASVTDLMNWQMATKRKRKRRKGQDVGSYDPETINGWLRVLRQLFRRATLERQAIGDPTAGVAPLNVPDKQKSALTMDELGRFLVALRKRYPQHYVMVVVGVDDRAPLW